MPIDNNSKVDRFTELENTLTSIANSPNTSGLIVNNTSIGVSPVSLSPPTGGVGFILQAENTNSDNIRWCVGGVASATVGNLYESGRDTGYIPVAAAISVVAISGTQKISIQWIIK